MTACRPIRGVGMLALSLSLFSVGGRAAGDTSLPAVVVPDEILLDHDGPPEQQTPSDADKALALLADDEWNQALSCPESRAPTQPEDPQRHRCSLTPTAALAVGGATLWAGIVRKRGEHNGMYSLHESVVLLLPPAIGGDAPRVVHTLEQFGKSVTDCGTYVRIRRQRVRDLDRDGRAELCIESVEESGAGLFEVLDLGDRPWVPKRRKRNIAAFRFDAAAARLVRAATLDAACPRRGYRPFVVTEPDEDPVDARRVVQGEDRRRRYTRRDPERLGYGCGDER